METKELKITIPENQEIDWQESAKQEKIVFKKKDTKPRSWKEYCQMMQSADEVGYAICDNAEIRDDFWRGMDKPKLWRSTLPSKELAEAFLAMMQLMSLRQAWIGDWKPDWNSFNEVKWCIINRINEPVIRMYGKYSKVLSFPSEEMALDFMKCFEDLLEIAKPLI